MNEIIDNFNFIKNFCSMKVNIKRIRGQATDWEKIFAKDKSDKGLLSKIYKELLKLNSKKMRDFPGSPVVKTLRFQCRGPRFDPFSGN